MIESINQVTDSIILVFSQINLPNLINYSLNPSCLCIVLTDMITSLDR